MVTPSLLHEGEARCGWRWLAIFAACSESQILYFPQVSWRLIAPLIFNKIGKLTFWTPLIHNRFFMNLFYYQRSFSKKAIFSEKNARNHLWGDMTVLRGKVCLAIKINITFFVGNEVLNIFYSTIFLKKIVFSSDPKKIFEGMTIFDYCKTLKVFFSKLCFLTFQLWNAVA